MLNSFKLRLAIQYIDIDDITHLSVTQLDKAVITREVTTSPLALVYCLGLVAVGLSVIVRSRPRIEARMPSSGELTVYDV